MSAVPKDGGPAFARPASPKEFTDWSQDGMSLRDWFAGQALAIVAAPDSDGNRCQNAGKLACWAYQQADAMLAERAKEKP